MPDDTEVQLPFELQRKDDGVVLVWTGEGPQMRLVLGAFDPVCEKLCKFLEAEDFGEGG